MTIRGGPRAYESRALLALIAAIAIALIGAWWASVPPPALGVTAPPGAFAARRAMADVRAIGRAPHPAGSAEHRRVRALLVARMSALGLAPRIVPGRGMKVKPGAGGTQVDGADVLNLVGTLAGRDAAAPAILLMAHYDSVPGSPGAADDGAGIAAALEIVRALRAGPPPARTVTILFTDAEEDGLLGARAFFGSEAARRIGFVVNMDVRGGAGRAIMHETGQRSGGAIALYRRSAIHPTTDSIAAWVERLIRNSSDFRIAVDAGHDGLNFAFLDKQFDYHAASSTPAALDARTLQHMGEQVLAVTRAAANEALPVRSADPAYASVLGRFVIAYPPWIGWLIAAAGLLLAAIAWRRTAISGGTVLRAGGAGLHLLLMLALMLSLARLATGVPFGFTVGRPLLARWEHYEAALALLCLGGVAGWWALALAGARRTAIMLPPGLAAAALLAGGGGWAGPALAAVAALVAVPSFRAPLPGAALGLGLGLIVALLAALVLAAAPVAAVVVTWSLLAGGLVLLATTAGRRIGFAAAAVVAGLIVAQQIATGHLLLLAVGETIGAIAAPFAMFAAFVIAGLLAPLLTVRRAGVAGAAGLVAGIALILAIRLTDPASAERPGISQVLHVSDMASGHFYRATSLAFPDRWTWGALGARSRPVALLPFYDHAFVARGERVAVAPISVRHLRQPNGRMLVRIAGPPGTRELRVAIATSMAMRRTWLNGATVPLLTRRGAIDRIGWVGRDPVVMLLIAPAAPGRLVMRIAALRDGWPADARPLPPRPATTMPWYDSDSALILATASISF